MINRKGRLTNHMEMITMPDLDMSDVLADARDMEWEHWNSLWIEYDRMTDAELGELHYAASIRARAEGDIMEMRLIDHILLGRIITELCEGCFGRWGCDMCNPPQFEDFYASDDQDAHYERFGRPAFPNEY